jgi:hypothetical protein
MQEYDKSSKWLIQHHGDSILRIAGIDDLAEWRPLQAELVQPRRLPDGLIEGRREGRIEHELFILEIATYPEPRIAGQILDDLALVYLDRRILPETPVLVLHPRGNQQAASRTALESARGWAHLQASWRVVELWTVPAERLLAAGDVGLIPWVPLAQFDDAPETIFQECRLRIDRDAPPGEQENLLAVTQVLAGLRYNDARLFDVLGGRKAMIESPVLQELKAQWTREGAEKAAREAHRRDILDFLVARFGAGAEVLEVELQAVEEASRLKELVKLAASTADLDGFRAKLAETPNPR